jgi:starch-binding outer membrane protein, SusD/RagB family
LINLFGDVPLYINPNYIDNLKLSKSDQSEVYNFIISELLKCYDLLSGDYSFSTNERIKPNKYAAKALLSRVYLFSNRYQDAVNSATEVLANTSQYSLLNNLNDVFLKNSQESIWQLIPGLPGINTFDGYLFILLSTPVDVTLSSDLLNAFDPDDKRLVNWIKDTTIESIRYSYPYKYKVRTNPIVSEYTMVLRLAEQNLIRAEANCKLGNIDTALGDVNTIRLRAGLNPLPALSQDSLMKSILQEKQRELFSEWGNRWFDIKRNRLYNSISKYNNAGWTLNDSILPIPLEEVRRNPNINQNTGY